MSSLKSLSLIFMVIFPALAWSDVSPWYPPDNPDPRAILNEAKEDRLAGRYQQALEKHVWFHESALTIDRGLYGVRLSFALMDWRDLANRYPPAVEKMREIRDRAERWVRDNKDDFDAFHDFVALNRELKEADRTVYLFQWLDENEPRFAERVFSTARDSLIAEGAFELCGKYVGGVDSFRADLQRLQDDEEMIQRYGDPEDAEVSTQALRRYTAYGMSNNIATLVRIGRSDQATEAGNLALEEFGDARLRASIERAMNGE